MTCTPLPTSAPSQKTPSRNDNPFATCWTRPGAIPFRFPKGSDAAQLIAKLAAQNWQGAIIGPHGSGKSTLLETLKPTLVASGRTIHATTLRDGQRRLPAAFVDSLSSANVIAMIDGYEQLSWFARWQLARQCRHSG